MYTVLIISFLVFLLLLYFSSLCKHGGFVELGARAAEPQNLHAKRARTSDAAMREIKTACPDSRGFDCHPHHLILKPGVTTCLVSISTVNHRLDSNMKLRVKVWHVWQEIKTSPHALLSFSMAMQGDTPKNLANVQRAWKEKDNSAVMKVDDHSGRFKQLLPRTISSPD